jgi:hypothetical protein
VAFISQPRTKQTVMLNIADARGTAIYSEQVFQKDMKKENRRYIIELKTGYIKNKGHYVRTHRLIGSWQYALVGN